MAFMQIFSGSERARGLAAGNEAPTSGSSIGGRLSAGDDQRHCISFNMGDREIEMSNTLRPWKDGWAPAVMHSPAFAIFINASIVISAVQMGVQADVHDESVAWLWNMFEHVFTAIFAVEMMLRIFVLHFSYFTEYWNVLDCLIAWVSIIYAWILPAIASMNAGSDPEKSGIDLSIIKVFRLLRLFRVLKLMKAIPEFRMVIEGIAASMRALFWVCLLLLVTVYTFAIFCVEIVGSADADTYPGFSSDEAGIRSALGVDDFNNYEYFGDLGRAMMSLFSISLLAEWDAIRPIWEFQRWCVPVFLALVFVTSFGIVNVIIGVIVESTTESMQEMHAHTLEEEKRVQMQNIENLAVHLWEHDADQSGEISMSEMRNIGASPEIRYLLDTLDLPKGFTFDDLFTMLNIDGKGDLSKKDFLTGMQRLVFSNPFQKDCLQLLSMGHVQTVQRDVGRIQERVNEKHFRRLQAEVQSIRDDIFKAFAACGLTSVPGPWTPRDESRASAFSSHGWRDGGNADDPKQHRDSNSSPRRGKPTTKSPEPGTAKSEGDSGPRVVPGTSRESSGHTLDAAEPGQLPPSADANMTV